MFGTLRPHTCELEGEVKSDYKQLYCGTCEGLGTHFGAIHRATLTWDAVLLAAAVDGLTTQGAEHGTCRCPLNPLSHREIIVPESTPMRVAAAVQVLLTNQWIADQQRDGSAIAGLVRPVTESPTASAIGILADLGIDATVLTSLDDRQGSLERAGISVREAAAPTRAALGALFAQLPELPGAVSADTTALRQLGESVGDAIYVIDALEDVEKDAAKGDFNPCLTSDRQIDGERIEDCVTVLLDAVATIELVVGDLPIQRHREIIRHVLVDQLPRRADIAVNGARDAVFRRWQAMSGREGEIEEIDQLEEEQNKLQKRAKKHNDDCDCCICDCGPISGGVCADTCQCTGESFLCCQAGCCCLEFLI